MSQHDMKLVTNRLFVKLEIPWCHQATCECGADSGPLWMSRKSCYRWFGQHKKEN
jgi:hypothetical protein